MVPEKQIDRVKARDALAALYPQAFRNNRPLAIGIKAAIMADLRARNIPEKLRPSETVIDAALNFYCRSFPYLRNVKTGVLRISLHGLDSDAVTPEEQRQAEGLLTVLRSKRKTGGPAGVDHRHTPKPFQAGI